MTSVLEVRRNERLEGYKARAAEQLRAAEERRAWRAEKRARPRRVKITSALTPKEWEKRKARRKQARRARRRNRR